MERSADRKQHQRRSRYSVTPEQSWEPAPVPQEVQEALARLALRKPNPDGDWRSAALCSVVDPAIFYAETNKDDVNRAKEFCKQCPVAGQCLEYALENREQYFVWGNMAASERRELLKRRRR